MGGALLHPRRCAPYCRICPRKTIRGSGRHQPKKGERPQFSFVGSSPCYLSSFLLSHFVFNDSQLAAIVTTSGAYRVVDVPCATVGANGQRRSYSLVVSSTLQCSGFGLSSFRMCHFLLSIYELIIFLLCSAVGVSKRGLDFPLADASEWSGCKALRKRAQGVY